VPEWIETANDFDLYLYLDEDASYVQDGTRLPEADRNKLNESHKQELISRGINYVLIKGNDWEERFKKAVEVVNEFIKQKKR
jgi:HTH-type transcriptional repressor of NAD biosynthesis genes